jgi:hypothetical protein
MVASPRTNPDYRGRARKLFLEYNKSSTLLLSSLILISLAPFAESSSPKPTAVGESSLKGVQAVVSIVHQRMYVLLQGKKFRDFAISTSKYGIGDEIGSFKTPKGLFRVHCKLGDGLKSGVVFKSREPTSEIVAPNAPGRDPIVTRIIWLEGLEDSNRHAFQRCIYIHGTPQEKELGHPVSFGCIRMASRDVIKVYDILPNHARVAILDKIDKAHLKKMHYVEEQENVPKSMTRA